MTVLGLYDTMTTVIRMILTKITYDKKNKAILETDEGYSVVFEPSTVLEFSLQEGDELSEAKLTEIIRYDMAERAKGYALNYISYRMRSEKEVADYLHGKEFDSEISSLVISRLRELGYLDDFEFAEAFVRDRLNLSKHGKSRIEFELKLKGIDSSVIQEVLRGSNAEELRNAVQLIQKKAKDLSDFKERRRITGMLARKGYSFDLISRAISLASIESDDE